MGLMLAIKSFFKALKDPVRAKVFVSDKNFEIELTESNEQPSHLRLLHLLQQSSRLIDFLKEDISAFDDSQVGAAVRKIHEDCGNTLEELVTIRPVMEQSEGQKVNVPHGYDPLKIKVVGNVKGEPPFVGILVHKGWKAHKRSLPKKVGDHFTEVICPAEVEIR
jgi:hypothetical protein